jgi:hypothetical protein
MAGVPVPHERIIDLYEENAAAWDLMHGDDLGHREGETRSKNSSTKPTGSSPIDRCLRRVR